MNFLFNTIERVIAAILPKVGLESVRRAAPQKPALEVESGGMTLKDLSDRYQQATTPEDKDLYRSLIVKLRDRM